MSLAIGVCALTLLLAATVGCRDELVGSLLGDTIAVDVRSTDYIAAIATIVLGAAAVTDVLFLGIRERADELATLRATGWDDRALIRLITYEGLAIGIAGSLLGAGLGLAGAASFAGALPASLVQTTLAAVAAGTLAAAAAVIAPAIATRRLPLAPVLAGE
jgi:ABC-type antimicrobial peptide transport system permease subunit